MHHAAGNLEHFVENIFKSDFVREGLIQPLYLLLLVSGVSSAFVTKFEKMVQEMPALISVSFFVRVSDILELTSQGDELATGHTLLGKGQERNPSKRGGHKRGSCWLLDMFL